MPHAVERIVGDLRRLGVSAGDLIMVHASLRKIGPVVGRAAGVIAAIDAAVDRAGTWMMVLGADQTAPFERLTTRAEPDVGVLAEVMRTTYGTEVSDHPEGRFAARGRLAVDLTGDVPWDDYYGPGSPLARLVEAGGKIVRLGADPDTTTVLHYAEYLADLPNKRRVTRHPVVSTPSGPATVEVSCLDDEHGIAERPGEDYFITVRREYLATGRGLTGLVGDAPSELLDAADLVRFAAAWMTQNLTVPE